MDLTKHNSNAWDNKVEEGSRYTQAVSRLLRKHIQSPG